MQIDINDLQTTLYDHKVYSAWQFIQFTYKNINTVRYCYQTINSIISKLTTKTVDGSRIYSQILSKKLPRMEEKLNVFPLQ